MALHGHNFLRQGSCPIVAVQHHGLTQALGCAREFDRFSATETSQLPFCSFARSRAAFDLSRVAPKQSDLLIRLRSYPNRRRVGPRAFFSLRSAACGLDTGLKTAGLRPSLSAPEALKLTRMRTLTFRSSRTCFVTPAPWQVKLATVPATLRKSA